MHSQVVEYQDDEVTARIVVVRANFGQELDRSDLIVQAEAIDEPRAVRRYVHKVLRPALVAATTEAQISFLDQHLAWPLAFEDLLSLPPELVEAWTTAVYAQNPTWDPQAKSPAAIEAEAQAVQKKAPISTND